MSDVDHRLKLNVWYRFRYDLLNSMHHQPSIAQTKIDTILHLIPIIIKLLGPLWQE